MIISLYHFDSVFLIPVSVFLTQFTNKNWENRHLGNRERKFVTAFSDHFETNLEAAYHYNVCTGGNLPESEIGMVMPVVAPRLRRACHGLIHRAMEVKARVEGVRVCPSLNRHSKICNDLQNLSSNSVPTSLW